MIYARDMTRYGAKGNKIHIMHFDDEQTLCHRLTRHRVVDGTKIQILYNTKGPTNCKGCITGLEIIAREMLVSLSATQLLEIVDILRKMRNGGSP